MSEPSPAAPRPGIGPLAVGAGLIVVLAGLVAVLVVAGDDGSQVATRTSSPRSGPASSTTTAPASTGPSRAAQRLTPGLYCTPGPAEYSAP